MSAYPSDFNIQSIAIEPYSLVDEVSSTEFYIGTSQSFSTQSAAIWRIKHIIQDGTVWTLVAYPDGDQGFKFKWSDRATYTYQ